MQEKHRGARSASPNVHEDDIYGTGVDMGIPLIISRAWTGGPLKQQGRASARSDIAFIYFPFIRVGDTQKGTGMDNISVSSLGTGFLNGGDSGTCTSRNQTI